MASIEVPGLGKLSEVPNSPPGERFWAGSYRYHEEGGTAVSVFFLCVSGDGAPSRAQLEFARTILAAIDAHLVSARGRLAEKLRDDPGFFGIDGARAARYLETGDAGLPFGLPEPTFFAPEEWHIRFAESPLSGPETLGVSVTFQGTTPLEIEDLSGALAIE